MLFNIVKTKKIRIAYAVIAAVLFCAGFAGQAYAWINAAGKHEAPPAGWSSSVSLIAKADVSAGHNKAQVCGACHTFDKGGSAKVGPNLYNIVNRVQAQAPEFSYSDAIKGMGTGRWSYEALDSFLFDPRAYAPGTKMTALGIKDAQERANVIAWLRTLSDKPAALPK